MKKIATYEKPDTHIKLQLTGKIWEPVDRAKGIVHVWQRIKK